MGGGKREGGGERHSFLTICMPNMYSWLNTHNHKSRDKKGNMVTYQVKALLTTAVVFQGVWVRPSYTSTLLRSRPFRRGKRLQNSSTWMAGKHGRQYLTQITLLVQMQNTRTMKICWKKNIKMTKLTLNSIRSSIWKE